MDTKGTLVARKAWYAGAWYPAQPHALRATIEKGIEEAQAVREPEERGTIRFAVLPHAGLAYSARGIAHLILHAPKNIQKAVILSPSHNVALPPDTFSVGRFSRFETPLGNLESFDLFAPGAWPDYTAAIQREHAVEMVLPFLAYLQEKQNSPILLSMALLSHVTGVEEATQLAASLYDALGEEELESGRTLVIASSDFTHYGQRFGYAPFGAFVDRSVKQQVQNLDKEVANALAKSEVGSVLLMQRTKRLTVCGLAPATIVSALAKRMQAVGYVADYYTSLDVTGMQESDFVTYCTIFWR